MHHLKFAYDITKSHFAALYPNTAVLNAYKNYQMHLSFRDFLSKCANIRSHSRNTGYSKNDTSTHEKFN